MANVELLVIASKPESRHVSKLSDRLKQAKIDADMSIKQIVKRATDAGYELSDYSAKVYTNGKHSQSPQPETLRALAYALRVPEDEVFKLAGLPVSSHFEPHRDADLLTATQRDAVNQIIRLLAEGNKNASPSTTQESGTPGETNQDQKTPDPPLDRLGYDLAATTGQRALDEEDANASTRGEENQDT